MNANSIVCDGRAYDNFEAWFNKFEFDRESYDSEYGKLETI